MSDQCNHLWRYSGNKRQAAWVCSYCQALRVSEPPARDWVGLTDEEIDDLLVNMSLGSVDEDVKLIEAKLREKNT